MKIYIPTRGRPARQPTYETLLEAGYAPTLVLSRDDSTALAYKNTYGRANVLVVRASNLCEKRQAILNNVAMYRDQKFVMMDDDLTFFSRQGPAGTFKKSGTADIQCVLSDMEFALKRWAHVGISDKFMCQTKPRGSVTHGRYNQVMAYNPRLFPKPWPKFRMITNQEHDFHLQLATRGRGPLILTDYSKDAKYYADGGCSSYRTPTLERKVFRQMAKTWPDFVTLVKMDKRPGLRMTVKWKKAVEAGRKK